MKNKLKDLSNKIWRTEKARFTASERCRKKHQALVFAISILSITQVLVAISSICGFYLPIIGKEKAEYMTLIASVLILVIANQDSLSMLLNHSDSYHRCGNKLLKLQQRIELELANDVIQLETLHCFAEEYSETLEFHDLNHTLSDYNKMKSQYPEDFKMTSASRKIHEAKYLINIYWLPIAYCIAPFLIISVAIKIASCPYIP